MVCPGKSGAGKSAGDLINDAHPKTVRRIVLLGLPGAGKSASGNTILGSDQFESDCCFDAVTTEAVSKSAIVEGQQVTVVDTPGFSNEVLTFTAIKQSLVKASPGPHAFVFVVRLGRITPADVRMFEHLPKLFDSEACSAHKYSMVLFTHGNGLKGRSIDDMIHSKSKNAQHVSKLVTMCGGRYCVFDNGDGNREQVRNLLKKIDEMVEANGGQHFTNDKFRMADRFENEGRNVSAETGQTREAAGDTGVSAIDRQLSKLAYDHLFELFIVLAGLIIGGAAGGIVAAKYGCGCKVAMLLAGGTVGAAVGTAVAIGGVKVTAKVKAKVTAKAKARVMTEAVAEAEAEAEAIIEAEIEAKFPNDSK